MKEQGERLSPSRLEVVGVTKIFGGTTVLRELNLVTAHEPPVAVIGPNGSGKTTLLNLLSGNLRPDHGKISLDRTYLNRLPPYQRARLGVRRTFQTANAFGSLTVSQNVSLALDAPVTRHRASSSSELKRLIESIGLGETQRRSADELSFGQRKLLSLAAAVAHPFKLLLLDEPVAGLDNRSVQIASALIRGLSGLIVIVEHNFDFIRALGCRVFLLDRGQLAAEGSIDEVLASDAARRAYS